MSDDEAGKKARRIEARRPVEVRLAADAFRHEMHRFHPIHAYLNRSVRGANPISSA